MAPRPPPNFKRLLLHTENVIVNILLYIIDFGISVEIQSCGFILPLRENMITHSFTINFYIFDYYRKSLFFVYIYFQ